MTQYLKQPGLNIWAGLFNVFCAEPITTIEFKPPQTAIDNPREWVKIAVNLMRLWNTTLDLGLKAMKNARQAIQSRHDLLEENQPVFGIKFPLRPALGTVS